MKYTITIEDITAKELRNLCDMFNQEITVKSKADMVNFTGVKSIEEMAEDRKIELDKSAPVLKQYAPEDVSLVNDYNKLAAPDKQIELDSFGLPWDERIHAGTKAKNKDGSWKQRRGTDDATLAAVEAELKAVPPVNPIAMFTPAPPPPPIATPVILDAAAAVGIPAPAPAAPVVNFGTLTQRITEGFMAGKIDASYAPSICARVSNQFGVVVSTLTDLMNNQQMIEFADKLITSDNAGF